MAVLLPIWNEKPETARRVRKRIGAIVKWAAARGHGLDNPASDALGAALRKTSVVKRHHRALPHTKVADAIATVQETRAHYATVAALEYLSRPSAFCRFSFTPPREPRGHCPSRSHAPASGRPARASSLPALASDRSVPAHSPAPARIAPITTGTSPSSTRALLFREGKVRLVHLPLRLKVTASKVCPACARKPT